MNIELLFGIGSVGLGVVSLWIVLRATRIFPVGSELKAIAGRLGIAVGLLCAYSLWHVLREAFHWKKLYGDVVEYPEYILVAAAYVVLFSLALSMLRMVRSVGAIER